MPKLSDKRQPKHDNGKQNYITGNVAGFNPGGGRGKSRGTASIADLTVER
jgi:hypothetical protein